MTDAYTIKIFIPDGDPEGVKIVELLNWTGTCVAFPRSEWPAFKGRPEFKMTGVYILTGSAEGTVDELPTIYVGQGDEIGTRIELHYTNKDFWDWGYAFVARANALNRAHITWLEYALLQRAKNAERCHFDNANQPKEPGLSESERADTAGFLREMLRVLPLLGVRVFEKPGPVVTPGVLTGPVNSSPARTDDRDTVVVPAQNEGFNDVFLGENCWYAVRIGGGMLAKIQYIAVYQTRPVSAITHYAPIKAIEPYGDGGKYRLVFSEPAKTLSKPIPFADAPSGSMQGIRYTSLSRLLSAKRILDLFKPLDGDSNDSSPG